MSSHSFDSGVSSNITLIQGLVETATEEFILKKDFKTVFEICDTALKKIADSDVKDERFEDIKSTFCILGIQALAELNEWRSVFPWVLQQYEQQEKIPAKIMQICILLYTKVGEAGLLLDATSVWLHCLSNIRAAEYRTVMELFLLYILIPLGHLEEARELIQGREGICTLTEEQRRTALDIVEQKVLQNNVPLYPTSSTESSVQTTQSQGAVLDKLAAIVKYLYRKLLMTRSFHPHKVFLFAVLLYLVFIRNDPAHPSSFMWISKLNQLLRQMVTALFAPQYPTSRK